MALAGVYAQKGPNWDIEEICAKANAEVCTAARVTNDIPYQPLGYKIWDHNNQISTSGRFQSYVSDWSDTQQVGELYDLEAITSVPITLIIGENDLTCPASDAADLAARLSTLQNNLTIVGGDHMTFLFENTKGYTNQLISEMTNEVTDSWVA